MHCNRAVAGITQPGRLSTTVAAARTREADMLVDGPRVAVDTKLLPRLLLCDVMSISLAPIRIRTLLVVTAKVGVPRGIPPEDSRPHTMRHGPQHGLKATINNRTILTAATLVGTAPQQRLSHAHIIPSHGGGTSKTATGNPSITPGLANLILASSLAMAAHTRIVSIKLEHMVRLPVVIAAAAMGPELSSSSSSSSSSTVDKAIGVLVAAVAANITLGLMVTDSVLTTLR